MGRSAPHDGRKSVFVQPRRVGRAYPRAFLGTESRLQAVKRGLRRKSVFGQQLSSTKSPPSGRQAHTDACPVPGTVQRGAETGLQPLQTGRGCPSRSKMRGCGNGGKPSPSDSTHAAAETAAPRATLNRLGGKQQRSAAYRNRFASNQIRWTRRKVSLILNPMRKTAPHSAVEKYR
jgi:hypothetical protein